MAIITEDYVSFETAKLLKEKGFEERIRSWYDNNGFFHEEGCRMSNSDCLPPTVMAPTLQMAIKWLREVYNIHISVYVFNRELPITNVPIFYTCDIATKKLSSQQGHLRGIWNTYEQACEAAIKYSLKNLI